MFGRAALKCKALAVAPAESNRELVHLCMKMYEDVTLKPENWRTADVNNGVYRIDEGLTIATLNGIQMFNIIRTERVD